MNGATTVGNPRAMTMSTTASALLGTLLLAAGCVEPLTCGVGVAYRPWLAQGRDSGGILFARALREVQALGPRRLDVVPNEGRIVAFLDEEAETRERLVVEVTARREVAVDWRTEMASFGTWFASRRVCTSYDHSRERQLAARIVDERGP